MLYSDSHQGFRTLLLVPDAFLNVSEVAFEMRMHLAQDFGRVKIPCRNIRCHREKEFIIQEIYSLDAVLSLAFDPKDVCTLLAVITFLFFILYYP